MPNVESKAIQQRGIPSVSPIAVRALAHLPWEVKRWIAADPYRWRAASGLARRVGWSAGYPAWYRAANGPYAGIALHATHVNHLWVALGLYEPEVSCWIVRLLRDARWGCAGGNVWDVGANVGCISLLCLKHTSGRVVSFEPGAHNLCLLREHLTVNAALAERCLVFEAAVSDEPGEVAFDDRWGAEGQMVHVGVRAWNAPRAGPSRVVKAVTLDSVFEREDLPVPALVKIDVEGAETVVLSGSERLLATAKPVLIVEVHNEVARDGVTKLLEGAGYAWRWITRRGLDRFPTVVPGHLLAVATPTAVTLLNASPHP